MVKIIIEDIKSICELHREKTEHFLKVDLTFYKKWKYLIKLVISLNKNYVSCEIARKEFKKHKNFIVIGLKRGKKPVKRRTIGYAKNFVACNENAKCIYCETKLTVDNATADHILPISKFGNNCQVNLVVCCQKCNSDRGIIPFNKFLKKKNKKYKNSKYTFI